MIKYPDFDETKQHRGSRRFSENAGRWHDCTFGCHGRSSWEDSMRSVRVHTLRAPKVPFAICEHDHKHNRQFYIV